MDLKLFHFAHISWVWALLFIPLVWGFFFLYVRKQQPLHQLEKFIDKHLIPHLLMPGSHQKQRLWTHLLVWSLVWGCLVLALAGPRWDLREISTFTRDQSLVIILDLSESMNAQDVPPSRLTRAKQKIEDLLSMAKEKGVKIGLVAFAADPHMIVPMTDDLATVHHLLPALDTSLVYTQGSKLTPALEMANTLLQNEPGTNKAIVVISDGGFEDGSAIRTAKALASKGITLYTIGVGSLEGAALKDHYGATIKKNGLTVLSKLEKEKFREISTVGNGRYFDADYSGGEALIFEDLKQRSDIQEALHKTHRIWEERFYLLLLPILPFFLWWCRRGCLLAVLFCLLPQFAEASVKSYFYNTEQQAQRAFEKGDFATASDDFQDPYRKGVSYYRMGNFKAAEEMFRQSKRPEVASSAAYNLANCLVKQNQLRKAITAYEDVLKTWPDHAQAKENLELVKKMLEEQQQQQQNQDQNQPSQKEDQESQKEDQKKDPDQQDRQEQSEEPQDPPENQEQPPKEQEHDQEQDESKETPQNQEEEHDQEQKNEQDQEEQPQALQDREEQSQPRSQQDLDADLWLDQIKNDSKTFLKNKFYMESKKNGPKEEVDPW